MAGMTNAAFKLICSGCGATYDPPRLHCDGCEGLLRSQYSTRAFHPRSQSNLFSFQDWLPPSCSSDVPIGSAVYPSQGLADHLGLSNLSIGFSGYAPAVGALNPTGSFKDFEAIPSLLYYREHGVEALVLASAGNTARAFAYAATQLAFPVIIVVPERALERLWIPCEPSEAVRLVVLEGCDDYARAIQIASLIGQTLEIQNEGGARNVARRDGMSTAMLEYAKQMGALPSHYFQAVGSGTGAIATWEASQRLLAAGIGAVLPALHLSQNAPFTPIHDAWTLGSPISPDTDVAGQLRRIDQIDALVLANRMPPYAIPGGVREALMSTGGHTYAVTNEQARAAAKLFEQTEGLVIGPAAAVSTAALLQAIQTRRISPEDSILLHITGNNESLIQRDSRLHRILPVWSVRPESVTLEAIREAAYRLLSSS
ncbi:MAG: cysteate synthase [Candidatus Atribacteria bacterium]|nr:MAG: cysteate synthase [Candidatus Atribacteria bacterium]